MSCLKSFNVANVLTLKVLPGSKFLLLGTKEGLLMLFDIKSSECVQQL